MLQKFPADAPIVTVEIIWAHYLSQDAASDSVLPVPTLVLAVSERRTNGRPTGSARTGSKYISAAAGHIIATATSCVTRSGGRGGGGGSGASQQGDGAGGQRR